MRYGYWMPVFGGWLRNVEDENMPTTWEYVKKLAIRSEEIGFDLKNLKAERLFVSSDRDYESVVAILDDKGPVILNRRESPSERAIVTASVMAR